MPFDIPAVRVREVTDTALQRGAEQFLGGAVQDIPQTARVEIENSVRVALEREASQVVDQVVRDQARGAFSQAERMSSLGARLTDNLAVGKLMATMITEDAQYAEIVAKNARMMRIKYDALVTAGFTEEQAFRLLEVEMMGKAGARAAR